MEGKKSDQEGKREKIKGGGRAQIARDERVLQFWRNVQFKA